MAFQVWARDQYGRNEILTVLSTKGRPESEWETADEALAAAKRYVHDKNRNNPLTFEEQARSANHVVMEVGGGIYAGNLIMGRHKVIVAGQEHPMADTGSAKFYLGQDPNNKPWYLQTPRRQLVTNLEDPALSDRTVVFVHALKGVNKL